MSLQRAGHGEGTCTAGELRRRRGQPGERRGFGGARLEAGQEGTGGAAASLLTGRGFCPRSPLGVPPVPGPEDTFQHVPAVVVSSPVLAPLPGLGPPPPLRPHHSHSASQLHAVLIRAPCPVPLLHQSVSPGSERPGRDPRRTHSSARSHSGHLIPLPSSTLGPFPSGPLSPGPALR